MATTAYMSGRRKYIRPQAILFSDNPGTISGGYHVPSGNEIGEYGVDGGDFIILSDDNRQSLDFRPIRIERRERMINGRMRSYHIADKIELSVSWNMLPSRSFKIDPSFNSTTGKSPISVSGSPTTPDFQHTTDGGAGGVEILDWYENHKGSFWVFLAYDKYNEFDGDTKYSQLQKYNQVIEMYITDFNYSVQKRGGGNHDFWNISIKLEEV